MDRGIPTEETLEEMRTQGTFYLVGTPSVRGLFLATYAATLPLFQYLSHK